MVRIFVSQKIQEAAAQEEDQNIKRINDEESCDLVNICDFH